MDPAAELAAAKWGSTGAPAAPPDSIWVAAAGRKTDVSMRWQASEENSMRWQASEEKGNQFFRQCCASQQRVLGASCVDRVCFAQPVESKV